MQRRLLLGVNRRANPRANDYARSISQQTILYLRVDTFAFGINGGRGLFGALNVQRKRRVVSQSGHAKIC